MAAPQTWARRIVMPLVILAVAAALLIWGRHQREQQHREVQAFVLALCDDVARGRDPAPHLAAGSSVVTERLVPRLRQALAGSGTWVIVVMDGDTDEVPSAGDATHHARIDVDQRFALGLRLVHRGDRGGIAIIGFWTPSAP